VFPRILRLLPTIYRRFQQNSKTIICTNKKGVHRQVGMGRQGTTSICRIRDKAHPSTCPGLLRLPHTNQDRNRRLKIRMLGDTITTMSGWKVESSGILLQNNVESVMQLRYTRQGTTDNSLGIAHMEMIYKGKLKPV